MNPRGSLTGPLVLIVIGVLFLIHAVVPDFAVTELLSQYWPYLLILWGVIGLVEVCVRFATSSGPVPTSGISGGAWFAILLICLIGVVAYEVRRSNPWWRQVGFERGIEAFGSEHEYSIEAQRQNTGAAPRVILESFRGDAKIVGAEGSGVSLTGRKLVRAFDAKLADSTNTKTPIELVVEGNTVIVRCHQDRADSRARVTTNLELSVPKGASVEATGTGGDFEVSSLTGDVDLSSSDAGVRINDVDGSLKIDTRHSDTIRCSNVKGSIDLRGRGSDVDLQRIGGAVTVSGTYTGSVLVRDAAKQVLVESMRAKLEVQRVPGEIRLERGSLNARNVIGPVKLTAHSTDVTVSGFTGGLEMSVDRGDIALQPQNVPLGPITVRTRSGNVEMALPLAAKFALIAATNNGEIDNQFGDALQEHSAGRGAKLEGTVGTGPDVNLITQHGTITVRKSTAEPASPKESHQAPANGKPAPDVARGGDARPSQLAARLVSY